MKFICDKEKLHQAVQIIQRGVSSKTTLPILTGVLLHAENQLLTLRATDLELSIQFSVPAQVTSPGSTVVSARHFSDIVRRLPQGNIAFSLEKQMLFLQYRDSELNLNTWSPEEFPGLPSFETNTQMEFSSAVLRNMIKSVAFSASHDENRPLFTACLVDLNSEVSLVATDTHRLAWKKVLMEPESTGGKEMGGPVSSLVPARAFLELARFLDVVDEKLKIGLAETYVSFEINSLQIISRLVEGKFPNYRQVIPAGFETIISAPRQELIEAIERASVLVSSREGASIVRMEITDDNLIITSKAVEIGSIKEVIPITITGKGSDIAFNSKYLLDGLKAIETESVTIKINGPHSAGIIVPENDENYIYLILPIRTQT